MTDNWQKIKSVFHISLLLIIVFLPFNFSKSYAQIIPAGQIEFDYIYDKLERYDALNFDRFDYQIAPYNLTNIKSDGGQDLLSALKNDFQPILSLVQVKPDRLRFFAIMNEGFRSIRKSKPLGYETIRGGVVAQLNEKLSIIANIKLDEKLAQDSLYRGKKWRGLAGDVERAIVNFKTDKFDLTLGRFGSFWGSQNSLILSPEIKLDGLAYLFRWGRLTISYRLAQLSRTETDSIKILDNQIFENRFYAAHRLDIRLSNRIKVGLFETVIFGGQGRQFDLFYLNPLIFFHGTQLNEDLDDNTMLGFDFSIKPKRGWRLYGQLLVDDFQIEKKSQGDQEPDQFGLLFGSYVANLQPGFDLKFEYKQVRNWMYNQINSWNRYTTNDNLIPPGPGNDYDITELEFIKWWQPDFSIHMNFRYYRQGEGRVDAEWTAPWLDLEGDYSEPFPSGIIDRHLEFSLGLKGFQGNHLFIDFETGVEWRRNLNHIKNESATLPFLKLSISIFGSRSLSMN